MLVCTHARLFLNNLLPFTWLIYHYHGDIVADHYGCIGDKSLELDNYPKGNWFCNTRCEQVHQALMASIYGAKYSAFSGKQVCSLQ